MSTESRIYNKAIMDGLPALLAGFIVIQAAHETNGFRSSVFISCNNINGYKWVGQSTAKGPCKQSPEGDFYAGYNSIEDSVHEQTQWIKRRQAEGKFPADLNSITSLDQYAQLLKDCGWYGDNVSNYTNGLYRWLNILGDTFSSPVVGGSALLFILILGLIALHNKKKR